MLRQLLSPFTSSCEAESVWHVVEWWESRRFHYNAVVGATGIASCALGLGFIFLPPHVSLTSFFDYPLPDGIGFFALPIAYGVAANICFSFGWITHLLARFCTRSSMPRFGPAAFGTGLLFSIILTLGYPALCGAQWIYRLAASASYGADLANISLFGTYVNNADPCETIVLRTDGSYVYRSGRRARFSVQGHWQFDPSQQNNELDLQNFTQPCDDFLMGVERAFLETHLVDYQDKVGDTYFRSYASQNAASAAHLCDTE
ncbi:MAG TPA: hypothetical protein VME66_00270 [Candidatus Acidoferrales bacterium]|nr:hypothetical protein [Candidatus Acidoferrales bacterium]